MDSKFTISEVINSSWELVKKHIWMFVAATLGYIALVTVLYFIFLGSAVVGAAGMSNSSDPSAVFGAMFSLGYIAFMILFLVVAVVFQLGFLKMSLQAVDGETPALTAFKIPLNKLLNGLFAGIIFAIAFYIGLALCILPGIYLAVRLQFFMYYIVDQDCGAMEALSKSWERTKGVEMDIFLLVLVLGLINFVGALLCGIGTLVTLPLQYVALAIVYRRGTSAGQTSTYGSNEAGTDESEIE